MKIKDVIQEEPFLNIRNEVFEFAEKMLAKYTDKVYDVGGKEIFDAVWGPVEFNSAEVAILDSPLLQRLRRIKQLGLAGYVYCDAEYSRFSHTIGVFFLAGRMADILNRKVQSEKHNFVQIARLAALFHDVGHMYFSHVSEYYFLNFETFSRYGEVKAMMVRFEEVIDKDVALHELLSVMIVQSPAVRELLRKISTWMDHVSIRSDKDLDELIEYVSCMILGVANDEEILPFYQVINGSVDADKCDYLSRDSHATNVPVAVDIERLIHKLTVEEDTDHDQKSMIWNGDENKKSYYVPAVKESAEEALNQLLMARTIMFKSVYYHQKVRTAEVMLRNIFSQLNGIGVEETHNFCRILQTTDDFFGGHCYEVLKRAEIGKSEEEKKKIDEYNKQLRKITQELNDLNDRFLLKRACAISAEMVMGEKHSKYRFETEVLKLNNREILTQLQDKIQAEYRNICKVLDKSESGELVFMIIEYPKYSPDHSKLDTRISYGNGHMQRASEVFQSETWMGSKDSRHKDHYLVTNCQNRELAFVALQKVLYDDYNVVLMEKASVYCKIPIKEMHDKQNDLWEKGYYNSAGLLTAELLLPKYKKDIKEIASKYQTYEGKEGQTVNEERIHSFLRQFLICDFEAPEEMKQLLEGVLKMLKRAFFVNRREFDDSLRKLLMNVKEDGKSVFLCPLGGIKDSAKHMTYYLNDLQNDLEHSCIKESLKDILKEKKVDKIVFFDDGAYSGKQVVSVFQEYMGVPIEDRETQEAHVDMLTSEEVQRLKKCHIVLMYICFNEHNKKWIIGKLQEIGLEHVDIIFGHSMTEKAFSEDSVIFADSEQKRLVCKYMGKIGKEILNTAKREESGEFKEKWTDKRVEDGKLGYNDAQQMVILKSNVPTYTITLFWLAGGKFKMIRWMPLFVRTDK